MSDLVAFLRARLDEDEAAAKATFGLLIADIPDPAMRAYFVRFGPARVLRDVEAKRKMFTWLTSWPFEYRSDADDYTRLFMHLLAAPYSDHDDYQKDWA